MALSPPTPWSTILPNPTRNSSSHMWWGICIKTLLQAPDMQPNRKIIWHHPCHMDNYVGNIPRMALGSCLQAPRCNRNSKLWQSLLECSHRHGSKTTLGKIQQQPNLTMLTYGGEPWRLWLSDIKVSIHIRQHLLKHICSLAAQK